MHRAGSSNTLADASTLEVLARRAGTVDTDILTEVRNGSGPELGSLLKNRAVRPDPFAFETAQAREARHAAMPRWGSASLGQHAEWGNVCASKRRLLRSV